MLYIVYAEKKDENKIKECNSLMQDCIFLLYNKNSLN